MDRTGGQFGGLRRKPHTHNSSLFTLYPRLLSGKMVTKHLLFLMELSVSGVHLISAYLA